MAHEPAHVCQPFGASILVAAIAAEAQQAGKVARIGYLSPGTATANAGLRKASH